MKSSNNSVWALFNDGTVGEIIMTDIGSKERLYLEEIGLDNIWESAKKAINAADITLRQYKKLEGNFGFLCEFNGNINVMKSSASLAFALKFVQEVKSIPFSIAGTGVVNSADPEEPIKKVENINEKIRGVIDKLEYKDVIFYPAQNKDLNLITEKIVQDKGVILYPINTVKDAVFKLLEFARDLSDSYKSGTVAKEKKQNCAWMLIVMLLFISLLCFNQDTSISFIKNLWNQHGIQKKPEVNIVKPIKPAPKLQDDIIKPVKKENSVQLPIRLKIDLTGDDPEAVSYVKEAVVMNLQNQKIIENASQYDGIITGRILIIRGKDEPLQPNASERDTLVSMKLVLENIALTSKKGDKYVLGSFFGSATDTKDREHALFKSALEDITAQINFKKICSKIKFNLKS